MSRRKIISIAVLLLSSGMFGFFFGLWIPSSHRVMVREGLAGGFGYGNDFYQIWITSHELWMHHADAYSADVQRQIEVGLYGRALDRSLPGDATAPFRGDCYPLHASVLALPLSPLPFPRVQLLLSILLPAAVTATVLLWCFVLNVRLSVIERSAMILFAMSAVPVLEGLYALQTSLIVGLLVAVAIFLIRRQQLFVAGALLALATVKPQLILLLMVWLSAWTVASWRDRKNLMIGFVGTTAVLLGVTTLVSPDWFTGWMHSVHEYRRICPPPLAEFVLGRLAGLATSLILVGAASVVGWREMRKGADSDGFVLATVLIIAVAVLVLPSTIAVYDQFLLFPAVVWLYAQRENYWARIPLRWLARITAGALAWQWVAACAILVISLLAPATGNRPEILLIPLRTAASVPFGVVGLISFVALGQRLRATSHEL